MINNNKRNSNSKLAQFKAAVAHLPFNTFNENNNDITATYITKGSLVDPAIKVEVRYNPNLKGTSCNFTIYRNDVQTDSYGCYDIDEFVEQLEPYFNLGSEDSLLKQLDRRLTKLEMLANDGMKIEDMLYTMDLYDKGEQELIELLDKCEELVDIANELEDNLFKEGFVAALTMLGIVDSNYSKSGNVVSDNNGIYKGKLGSSINGDKLPGTNRSKSKTFNVNVDETTLKRIKLGAINKLK